MILEPERGARPRARLVLFAVAVALLVTGLVTVRLVRRASAPSGPSPERRVAIDSPRGDLATAPDRFAWEPVPGAASYRVRIADADAIWPLFVRSTTGAGLVLEPWEASALAPGRIHEWDVEALDAGGALIASGGTQFRVRVPKPVPGSRRPPPAAR